MTIVKSAAAKDQASCRRLVRQRTRPAVLLALCLLATHHAVAEAVQPILKNLRLTDCGILKSTAMRWRPTAELDAAAARWAGGATLRDAVERSSYHADDLSGLHLYGLNTAEPAHLTAASCRVLRNSALQDVGLYRRRDENWMIFASRAALLSAADAATSAPQALQLVNDARIAGFRCGARNWPPTGIVRLSATLSAVAARHARDMADYQYLEHRDLRHHSPAERVKAAGYSERLVGENIAYGPVSTAEVIAGWLNSPEHCENLLNPRFKTMGIGYAQGRGTQHGLYWVQLLADPQ